MANDDEEKIYRNHLVSGRSRCRILGDLHDESYIYVEDVRAAAYGFGGRTQEFRYHQ